MQLAESKVDSNQAVPSPPSLATEASGRFRVKRALMSTAVAQVFSLAAMLLGLVSVPLYLSWLGEERYGLLLTGLAYAGYLIFADAGLSWSSMLLIAQAKGRDTLGSRDGKDRAV